jgi:hypothetical protein
MKFKKIIALLAALVTFAAIAAGCAEKYKGTAVSTDFESAAPVVSNGGLAVKAGKYLYYINGYTSNSVDNAFGKVEKGSIARVELDAEGKPIDSTNTIIVRKAVYNTVATSGLYVDGSYIYFTTPSTRKDSKGEPKTGEMVVMRSKLDGSVVEPVAEFKDYTPVYKIYNGSLLYVNSDKELHRIDLNSKKFEDTKIDEEISSYHMPANEPMKDGVLNSFADSVFYIKASEIETDSFNVVWCYRAGGGKVKVMTGGKDSYGESLTSSGYTLAIAESIYLPDNKLRLIYTKTDSGYNKKSSGTYSYDFDSSLVFSYANEVRYSFKNNYTKFTFLDSNNAIALSTNNIVRVKNEGGVWIAENLVVQSSAPTIFNIEETADEVYVYYIASSVIYKIPVMKKEGGAYITEVKSSSVVFDAAFDTAWLSVDRVGSCVYFFNTNISKYTYFVDLAAVVDRDALSRAPKLLSLVTAADEIAMITSST